MSFEEKNDALYYIALSMAKGINLRKKKDIVDFFSPDLEYLFTKADLLDLQKDFLLPKDKAKVFLDNKAKLLEKALKEKDKIEKSGIKVLALSKDDYPDTLGEIYDPPIVLYARGSIDFNRPSVGIIGSRKASQTGINNAFKLSKDISAYGISVVSGLALGIDGAAHKGSIAGGGQTIAVLGSGIDVIYPSANKDLFYEIIDNGCVLSEHPLGTPPLHYHFPIRNRIIAGLSLGVVVVEAAARSGILHTAACALENGIDVYAFPGPAGSPYYAGTNSLIKQGAAGLIENANDLIKELELIVDFEEPKKAKDRLLDTAEDKEELRKEILEDKSVLKKDGRDTVSATIVRAKKEAIIKEKEDNSELKEQLANLGADELAIYNCLSSKRESSDDIVDRTGLSIVRVIGVLNSFVVKSLCSKEGSYYYKDYL